MLIQYVIMAVLSLSIIVWSDNLELPKQKKIRLDGYDYSESGAYFITICTKNRHEILWNVGEDIIRPDKSYQLSEYGRFIDKAIVSISKHYRNVFVDKYVIMPNHVHIILILSQDSGRIISAPTKEISIIIGQMKRWVSQQIGIPLWQKSFHDHIIRNEREYQKISKYIDENPSIWKDDCFYNK